MGELTPEAKKAFLEAGRVGKLALERAVSEIHAGALLLDVATATESYIIELGAKPSFPINLSIDNEAAHYSPTHNDKSSFHTGDVVKVDIGASIDGYLSDNATTVEVGEKGLHSDIIDCTREALNKAIATLRPEVPIREIGKVIGETIASFGFRPVKNLGGHGVGRYDLHSSPFIPNYDDGNGKTIHGGSVIAIEPFASTGIGMIHNGPGGNIYILSGTKKSEDELIYKNFNTIPFSERWLHSITPDYQSYLKSMIKSRQVSEFAVLKEHRGTFISQAEHTVMITNDRVSVTTA